MTRRSGLILVLLLIAACGSKKDTPAQPTEREGRLSAAVVFVHSPTPVQGFLAQPGRSYVEAWFNFPPDLAPDIWFGIDQELVEGVEQPRNFKGADWMGLIAVNRKGQLGIPVGSEQSQAGNPDDAGDWEVRDLHITLKPDTWYRMRGIVDFASLRFEAVELSGPSVDVREDLSDLLLSYPNYIPFDQPSMTYYVFALRTRKYRQPGSTRVFFDDLQAGIEQNGEWLTVFADSFEGQAVATDIPVELPVSPLSIVSESLWYKEREEALLQFSHARQRSGNASLVCDATLRVQ